MRKVIHILCCLSLVWPFVLPLAAQQPMLDSLERLFKTAATDDQRLERLSELTAAAFNADLQTALGYAQRGTALAEKIADKAWLPKFQEMQGRMHANLGQLDSASLFFDKALAGYTAVGDRKGQATTYFKIAWVHKRKGELQQGLETELKALRLMEEIDDQEGIASALGRVSDALYKQEKPAESLEYAKRAIAICRKNNFGTELPNALLYAGYAAIGLGKHEDALTYFDEALKLAYTQNMGYSSIADAVNARGNAYKKLERYPEALADYQTCLENAEKANYPGGILSALANIGEVYLHQGNYAAALPLSLIHI